MRLLTGAFICCASLALASAIAAQTGASSGAPPAQAISPPAAKHEGLDPNRIVCKRETVTGSRIGGDEICMTWAQWDQIKQNDQNAFHRLSQTPTPPRTGGMAP